MDPAYTAGRVLGFVLFWALVAGAVFAVWYGYQRVTKPWRFRRK